MFRKFALIAVLLLTALPLPAAKVGDSPGKIGTIIDLSNGERLHLAIEDRKVIAWFIDDLGLIVNGKADSMVFSIDDSGNRNDKWRALIEPTDGPAYLSNRYLYPPYNFRARIIIRYPEADTITVSSVKLELEKPIE